ncbi:MAG: DUF6159 family protein [Acidimicrobiales bacterium]|nr:DUF6159 family protein [Acidimicrobiales bacterium]
MGRIRNTFRLARTSWDVLQKDRELALLPVISVILTLIVLTVFVVPGLLAIDWDALDQGTTRDESAIPALSYVLFTLGGAGAAIVSVFFVGALIAGAHERLSGGDPTVRSSITRAYERIPGLVPWALLSFTVVNILRALRKRLGGLGNFIFGTIEVGFDVAAFLTIPAIVIDNKGPIEGFKTSASLLRQTWGENLAARVGFGLLGFVAILPAVALIALVAAAGSAVLTIIGVAVIAVYIGIVFAVISAMSGIFQAALYLYATTGSVPEGFENAELGLSFARR